MAVSTHLKCLEVGGEKGGAKERRGQIIPGVHHTSRKGTLGVATCPYWEVVGQLDGMARPAECPGARSSHHCTKVRFIPNFFEASRQGNLMPNEQKQCRSSGYLISRIQNHWC